MNNLSADLFIITHKEVTSLPEYKDRDMLFVGAYFNKAGYAHKDNIGKDNISYKNKTYCELTGLYYIFKHINSDIVGLEHYRRMFIIRESWISRTVISKEKAIRILGSYDCILPYAYRFFNTVKKQYIRNHEKEDLDKLEEVIKKYYPEYSSAYDSFMNQHLIILYNMFIGKKNIIDEYCRFLFGVLAKLEKQIKDLDTRPAYQRRVFGFLSERLFNIWLWHNKDKYRYYYAKVTFLKHNPFEDWSEHFLKKISFKETQMRFRK